MFREIMSDADNRLSSKRFGGLVGLMVMIGITVFVALKEPGKLIEVFDGWSYAVMFLLGAGTLEQLRGKKAAAVNKDKK